MFNRAPGPRRICSYAFVLALGMIISSGARAQVRQNQDYCLPTATARIILVDVTTPYDATDKKNISSIIQQILSTASEGDRILIRTISDSYTNSEKLIERCIPSCKAEGFKRLTCNDGLMRIDRNRIQAETVETLGARLSRFEELKNSDIIRTINRSANEDFGSNKKVEMIIYSDLIENSDYLVTRAFYYYSTQFLIEGLKKLGFIPDLHGASVEVAGVGRSDAADRHPLSLKEMTKVNEFWKAYFNAAKAGPIYIGQNLSSR